MIGIQDDLRHGLRALAKHRAVSTAAVFSLALGIGANTTIFTLVNAILLRPLQVEEPSRLAALHTVDSRNPGLLLCSYPNYQDYARENQVFSSLLLYTTLTLNLTGRGDPQLLMGQLVSGDYFETLGVHPIVGRGFRPEEDASAGASPVAVISYGLWQRQYGGDSTVGAKTIQLNGRPFNIIGVAPAGFQGLNQLYAADVWVPLMMYPQLYPNVAWVTQRRALLFAVVGRLKPGITLAQAEAGIQGLAQELERQYPRDNEGRRIRLTSVAEDTLAPKTRAIVSNASVVLLIISGLVVLIACGNVANLLLARAAGRTREITVRLALGASRIRLIRQLLIESMVLALAGGTVALLLARWARDLLWSMRPPLFNHADVHPELGGAVLLYTLVISIGTGVLFGLVPALRSTKADLATDLKERTGQPASRGGWRPRSILVTAQIAFSVIALVGAGLFLRSVRIAGQIDPGFDAQHLGIVAFNVAEQGYKEPRGRDYQQRALEIAAATPGVVSATLSKDIPFHVSAARTVLLEGQDNTVSGRGRTTLTSVVWPGYFRTVGIPLVSGRDISMLDEASAPRVAIVNEAAATHFWPGENAIGKRLHFFGDTIPAQVVGVARNANYQAIGEAPQALIYLSLVQYYFPTAVLYFRTGGDAETVAAAVKRQLQPLDRNLMLQAESVGKTIRESLWAQRLSAGLLGVFGCLALVLATVGIYGVISYSVSQRAREIGVRMALGATAGDVQRMILRESLSLVVTGVCIGTIVALGASRTVEHMLFEISARDVATFVLVPTLLAIVGSIACWIPAIRATRIDPAVALREE
jgi:predicted permease